MTHFILLASSVFAYQSLGLQISLLNVEGTGMQGVSGIAERIFGALKNAGVSVTLITQASSEHSVTAAIPPNQGAAAKRAVEDAFFREISNNLIQTVDIVNDCSILAAVGDGMIHTRGVAAKLFTSLAASNINVLAIAQGSSERNISVVINAKDSDVALRTVHDHFYSKPTTSDAINVAIVGYGGVGTALARQLKLASKRLSSQLGCEIRLCIVARSGGMLVEPNLLDLDIATHWRSYSIPNSSHSIATLLLSDHPKAAVVIDTSASESVTDHYLGWMKQGIHVIAANKKFFSGNLQRFAEMRSLTSSSKISCSFEATVCAGLPVLSTIMDMVESGDEIETITGVFSGTLSFLFNTLRSSQSTFSQIVKNAKDLGYTEPDPRDDLSGLDFARKVVILARLAGLDADLNNVDLRGLVPPHLMDCSVADFMIQLESRT
jgi:bifunctional aspartokinase / homoserine dehydrogenase 1